MTQNTFALTNERGLFATSFIQRPVLTEARRLALAGLVAQTPSPLDSHPEAKKALELYLQAALALPVANLSFFLDSVDAREGTVADAPNQWNQNQVPFARAIACRAATLPSGWSGGSSPSKELEGVSSDSFKAALLALDAMMTHLPLANTAVSFLGYPELRSECFKGCKNLGLKARQWSFKSLDAQSKAMSDTCYALWRGDKEGYLCRDGGYRELSSALIFSSEGAASRAVTTHRAESALLVRVSLKPLSIEKEYGAPVRGAIDAAMAQAEREELIRGLEAADLDALRRRVAELEAREAPGDPAPLAPSARRSSL